MITGLRIVAFGDGGQIVLGRGIDRRNAVQLAPLSSHMRVGASGHCWLLGCNVASTSYRPERFLGGAAIGQRTGSPGNGWAIDEMSMHAGSGLLLVQTLARTLGVPVTVGLEAQSTPRDWHFVGATVTVDPFGQATFTGMDAPISF